MSCEARTLSPSFFYRSTVLIFVSQTFSCTSPGNSQLGTCSLPVVFLLIESVSVITSLTWMIMMMVITIIITMDTKIYNGNWRNCVFYSGNQCISKIKHRQHQKIEKQKANYLEDKPNREKKKINSEVILFCLLSDLQQIFGRSMEQWNVSKELLFGEEWKWWKGRRWRFGMRPFILHRFLSFSLRTISKNKRRIHRNGISPLCP